VDGVLASQRHGSTIGEIAEDLGFHPATVSGWLKRGGQPPARAIAPAQRVVDERWAARVGELIRPPVGKLLGSSVFGIIRAESFGGSYPTAVRHLRRVRSPRFRAAPAVSVPIEPAPVEERQFDRSDCSSWSGQWGLGEAQRAARHIRCPRVGAAPGPSG
jgi:hypothetical protein